MITTIDVEKVKRPEFDKNLTELIGYKPNHWQEIVRKDDYRFKVICVGRRGGKSYYVVYDTKDGLVADMVLPHQKVWVVAPNYDLTQRVWNAIYNLAIGKLNPIIKTIHNTKGDYKIETVLGTIIEAKSAEDPEKLVGAGLTKIIVDEAALVKKKAWEQSLRPTLIDHKGKAIFISTPKGKNWFWELWTKGQDKEEVEWKSWNFTSYENENLDKVELDKVIKDMPDYEYRQEILANFEETAEQIFRKFKEQAIGQLQDPRKGHRYQIGVDLGRKTSYTVISVVDEMTDPYSLVYWERFKIIDWSLQKKRIKEVWDKYPAFRLRVDSTGIGDPIEEELSNDNIRTEPFIYKETTKKQIIDKLSILIQEKRLIYPKIPELLAELETFGREISQETGRIKYKALGHASDDCVNSLALACWGLLDRPRKIIKDEDKTKNYKPISEITGY